MKKSLEPIIAGGVARIVDDQDRHLLVQRRYNGQDWTEPGGRWEPPETAKHTTIRETYEETRKRICIERLLGKQDVSSIPGLIYYYQASITGEDPWQPNKEIQAVGWFKKNEFPDNMDPMALQRIHGFTTANIGATLHLEYEHHFQSEAEQNGITIPVAQVPAKLDALAHKL